MSAEQTPIPTEFKKVIVDMTKDILVSFPEQKHNLHPSLLKVVFPASEAETSEAEAETSEAADASEAAYASEADTSEAQSLNKVYMFCKTVYPVRFFDILYQNNDIFTKEEIEFLPGINFSALWRENISDKTRETIWKYLQLVLFTVVSSISDGNNFGDTAKLFEAINADDFKTKLEETIQQMQSLFGDSTGTSSDSTGTGDSTGTSSDSTGTSSDSTGADKINLDDLPNPNDIHEHVTNMMNGKLGKLAREIAEETAADLNINTENAESINDVFKRLIQNPSKLLGLVKNVGSKLDEKIKSGDMKESELLQEASEMMKKMKNMPGMGDIQGMLNKMGMGMGMGGKEKVNVNAMQANLDRNLKNAKNKERLLRKLAENKLAQQQQAAAASAASAASAAAAQPPKIENLVFSTGENVERSAAREQPSKKKKNKKQK
jgi:hypothetical protein